MLARRSCRSVPLSNRFFFMTILATSCVFCFVFLTQPLILFHEWCIHNSIVSRNLREIVDEISTNGSTTSRPVNPTNVEYMHKPLHVCDLHNGPDYLLVLVKSDASNIARRLSIRQTWGNISHLHIKVIYLLGYVSVVQDMIDLESFTFKDVLQGHFIDIYDNNIYKTAMAYQYAVNNCINVQFLFFVDDDFFINILEIHKYLETLTPTLKSKLFKGHIIKNAKPKRRKSSKWYLTREEYPCDYFPNYPAGGAIIMSMNIAKLLQTAFPYVKYIRIDDVFLGIVAMKLNINLQHDERFDFSYTPPMHLKKVFASHGYEDHRQVLAIWDFFLASMSMNSSTDLSKQIYKS